MRLALLGLDETTVALAQRALNGARDELVMFCDVANLAQLQSVGGSAQFRSDPWESLLIGATGDLAAFDAVLVGRDADDDRRLDQLRKLVQAGVPMLLSHPVHPSMLAYYELDMIRRESGCVLVPCLPARRNPLVARLKEVIEQPGQAVLGQVDQILFERSISEPTKAVAFTEFARDIDLLRFLGGEVSQLGAMGLSPDAQTSSSSYRSLAVQMTSSQGRMLRWWVDPSSQSQASRVVASGTNGKATLYIPDSNSPNCGGSFEWRLEIQADSSPPSVETADWDPHAASLDELRATLSARPPGSRWPDAARAIELAETIDRSLTRRRTIDLYDQEFSDAATFKGLMTGVGCVLLLLALGATVLAALVANLLKHAGALGAAQAVGKLPYIFLGLFALFLALQFLLKLVQPPRDKPGRDAPDQSQSDKS